MFNNPFESFHNTVAQAKEEREQLERLLTISTPRERLLVGAIALLLLILAAWLFFGSVARTLAVDGTLIGTGDTPVAGGSAAHALIWVETDVAAQITTGLPAVVELATVEGQADRLVGEITRVSAASTEAVAGFDSVAPAPLLRVDIALREGIDLAAVRGRECRIVIGLGRQPPIALFGPRRS